MSIWSFYDPCLTVPGAKRPCLPTMPTGGGGGGKKGIYECNLMTPTGDKAQPNANFAAAFGTYIGDAPPATITTASDYATSAAHKRLLKQLAQHANWAYLVTKNKCNCQPVFGTSVWPPMADITKGKMILQNMEVPLSLFPSVVLEDIGIAFAKDDATLYILFRGAEVAPEFIASAFSAKQAPFELWFNNAKEAATPLSTKLVSGAFQDLYNADYMSNKTQKGMLATKIAAFTIQFPNVTKVIITGHSIGCINANFLHYHMTLFPDHFFATPGNVQLFTATFGSPRVAHPAFVSAWKSVATTLASQLLLPVINLNDPIPNIPIPANPVDFALFNKYTYAHMLPQLLGLRAANPLLESHHTNAYTEMIDQGVTLLDHANVPWAELPVIPSGTCP